MNLQEQLQDLQNDLQMLSKDWDTSHNQLDSNWVGVTISNKHWRVAKKLGAKKDAYYGWFLFSKSVNSNGSDFACKVWEICQKHQLPTIVRERAC